MFQIRNNFLPISIKSPEKLEKIRSQAGTGDAWSCQSKKNLSMSWSKFMDLLQALMQTEITAAAAGKTSASIKMLDKTNMVSKICWFSEIQENHKINLCVIQE